jgi:hypothetical protein
MCWSNIAKEGGKCPRHFFRLFDEQHMRPAWEHGKTRRRDGVRYPLYDRGRRRFVPAMQKVAAACGRRPWRTTRPPNHSDRPREVVRTRLCPCRRAKRGCEPPIEGLLEYISHAGVSRIVAALPCDFHTSPLSASWRRRRSQERLRLADISARTPLPPCRRTRSQRLPPARIDFVHKLMQIVSIVLERAHRHTMRLSP